MMRQITGIFFMLCVTSAAVAELGYTERTYKECQTSADKETGCVEFYTLKDKPEIRVMRTFHDGAPNGVIKSYYPNGAVFESGALVDGKREGLFRTFYEDGSISLEVMFENDQRIKANAYYPSGTKKAEMYFANNQWDGPYLAWHENGKLQLKAAYCNGSPEGPMETYYDNGNLSTKAQFVNGLQEGHAESYYSNGQLHVTAEYHQGKRNGLLKAYREDGTIDNESMFKEDLLNGESFAYYPNGQLEYIANFKNGNLDGLFTGWYENGFIREKKYFKNGKGNGKSIVYSKNTENQILNELSFKDGLLDGLACFYDEDSGIMTVSCNYKEGKLHGREVIYHDSGEINCSIEYEDGNFTGGVCPGTEREMTLADFKNMQNGKPFCDLENSEYLKDFFKALGVAGALFL